jgi:alkaline phosphatase D
LLGTVAERRVPGVVVMGGDVHANYVADLQLDFDDPRSPVLATEFCGTSISSLGQPQERLDRARSFNPHLHWARSDQRGYVRLSVTPADLQAALRVVADAREVDSPVSTAARYSVDPKRPGAVAA